MKLLSYLIPILFTSLVASGQGFVFDLYPGQMSSLPGLLTEYKGKLFFYAKDGLHGGELWAVDSVIGGPSLVADINPGPASSYSIYDHLGNNPRCLAYVTMATAYSEQDATDVLFFLADDGVHGLELYKYNGSTAPALEKEFIPGPLGKKDIFHYDMDTIDGDVYILLSMHDSNELWRYDVQSKTLKEINKGRYKSIFSVTSYKGKLYFMAAPRTGITSYPYYYDPVADTIAKAFNGMDGSGNIQHLAGKLYFTSNAGRVLFEYDGNSTPRVINGNIHGTARYVDHGGIYQGKLYYPGAFGHPNEFDPVTGVNKEVFKIDKNPGGFSLASSFIEYRNQMYFSGTDDNRNSFYRKLWEWDGVNAPKEVWKVQTKTQYIYPNNFHVIGDALYFVAEGNRDNKEVGVELHKYVSPPPITSIIETSVMDYQFSIYPNPATDYLALEVILDRPEVLAINISSTDGKKVVEISDRQYPKGETSLPVDVTRLPPGVYFYRVTNYEHCQVAYGKFVKR
ncbi:MAG TPA: T9SS type A sorting domain-containing protein [Flavipsychrobacter sp.]